MREIETVVQRIGPVDATVADRVQRRLDKLTKPRGSLGTLEDLARRYAAIRRQELPRLERKLILTLAADHGVTDEGVSAFPKEVTTQMVYNFLRGGGGINVLARHVGARVLVVDIGVDHEFTPQEGLILRKVARGTRNICKGPAMERREMVEAVKVGLGLVDEGAAGGADILGTGDMGIGNTTPSSAILAVMTGMAVEQATGRGSGVDGDALARKVAVIQRAIEVNAPDPDDPWDVLGKLGGLEIAGIVGILLGAAARCIPVVVDGFISGAAALVACRAQPLVAEYLFASHRSDERAHGALLQHLGAEALLDLNLRLGEGTGAALGIGLVEAGVRVLSEMATFGEAGVSESEPE